MKSKNKLFGLLAVRAYRKSVKYYYVLNIELEEILIGLMLGYLYAEKKIVILIQGYSLNNQ
jgi:hypothetical protein